MAARGSMLRRWSIGFVMGATCAVTAVASPAAQAAPEDVAAATGNERVVIADGHVDLGPRWAEDGWTVQLRDDTVTPATWRDLDDVVVQVVDAARTEIPSGEEFAFLGAAGAPVWVIPQVQAPGVIWPGWNTEDTEVAERVRREVTWTLHDVQGPGSLTVFLNVGLGEPEVVFDSRTDLPQSTGIEVNTHVHGNWAFSAPGSYLLDVEMSATTRDGEEVSDRKALRVSVGDADPEQAFDLVAADVATDGGDASAVVSSSSSLALPIVGVALVVLVAGVAFVLVRRRRHGGTDVA
jgi:putative ABC transporter-associated repeat protein